MSLRITLAAFLSVSCGVTQAQLPWPKGKQAAIVLTYDDALQSQLEFAVPQLAAARLRGTPARHVLSRWRHQAGRHAPVARRGTRRP